MLSNSQEQRENLDSSDRPNIYSFTDYRVYLNEYLNYLKRKNSSYSATAFCRAAGMGSNARGYFTLIVKNKRNLSSRSIYGFAKAMKLSDNQTLYFEALVLFNQAKTESDKAYFFAKLKKLNRDPKNPFFKVLESHYNYLSNWYYVAIRELVALDSFVNDPAWVSQKLKNRVTKKQVTTAIEDLLTMGILKREGDQLVQSNELVRFEDNSLNYTIVNNIHRELLNLAQDELNNTAYSDRSISNVVISTSSENFEEIREEIKAFREMILNKYGTQKENNDCILNLGAQLCFLTSKK